MQPLDKAVALRPAHLGGPVLNPLQLQEQLARVMVRTSAELAPIVRQDGIDPRLGAVNKKPGVGPGWQDKLLIQVFVEASSVDVV